jgi:hypothetical protein
MPLDSANWFAPEGRSNEQAAPIREVDDTTVLLARARAFLERGWCRYTLARDALGLPVDSRSMDAVSWCAIGALDAVGADRSSRFSALLRLQGAIGSKDIVRFNDAQETVETILAAFDRAIAAGGR